MNQFTAGRVDFSGKNILSTLFKLALPVMLSLFFENIYYLADMMFVSRMGTQAMAAVAFALPVFYLSLAVVKGLGDAGLTLMSNSLGAEKPEEYRQYVEAVFPAMMFMSIPFLLFLSPGLSRQIFRLMGASNEITGFAYEYTLWLVLSVPFFAYVFCCQAVFMSNGDSLTPMKGLILGNLINIVLDPILIFYLKLGVGGAGLATFIGRFFSALYLFYRLEQKQMLKPGLYFKRITCRALKNLGRFGAMIMLFLLVSPVSYGAMNRLFARFGPEAVAAWNIMTRIELIVILPLWGITNALIPFIGFNLGKKNYLRIKKGVYHAIAICLIIILPLMALLILRPGIFVSLFKTTPEVYQYAIFALKAGAAAYIFMPVELALIGFAQGLKRPGFLLPVIIFRNIILRISLGLIFSVYLQAKGVYLSHPAAIAGNTLLCIFIMLKLLKYAKNKCLE